MHWVAMKMNVLRPPGMMRKQWGRAVFTLGTQGGGSTITQQIA